MESLRNLSLSIMAWSVLPLALSVWAGMAFASRTKRITAELESEDYDPIVSGSAKVAYIAQVAFFAFILAIIILISGTVFGVGIFGFLLTFTIVAIQTGNPFVSIVFVAFGVFLYGARTRFPFWYGAVEVVFGASGIIYSVIIAGATSAPSNVIQLLLSVFGGIYVIVRGLDNMTKAVPNVLKPLWRVIRWNVPLEAR